MSSHVINFESLDIIFKQRRKWKVDIIVKKVELILKQRASVK